MTALEVSGLRLPKEERGEKTEKTGGLCSTQRRTLLWKTNLRLQF